MYFQLDEQLSTSFSCCLPCYVITTCIITMYSLWRNRYGLVLVPYIKQFTHDVYTLPFSFNENSILLVQANTLGTFSMHFCSLVTLPVTSLISTEHLTWIAELTTLSSSIPLLVSSLSSFVTPEDTVPAAQHLQTNEYLPYANFPSHHYMFYEPIFGNHYTNSVITYSYLADTMRPFAFLFYLPRDAMHKRGLCCHAVSVCVSITFMNCVKTIKHIKKFLPSGRTIIVFPC